MTRQELQEQARQLSVRDRWRLVQSTLASIQKETLSPPPLSGLPTESLTDLDPWTQSLMGAIPTDADSSTESYVDYLQEKYS